MLPPKSLTAELFFFEEREDDDVRNIMKEVHICTEAARRNWRVVTRSQFSALRGSNPNFWATSMKNCRLLAGFLQKPLGFLSVLLCTPGLTEGANLYCIVYTFVRRARRSEKPERRRRRYLLELSSAPSNYLQRLPMLSLFAVGRGLGTWVSSRPSGIRGV